MERNGVLVASMIVASCGFAVSVFSQVEPVAMVTERDASGAFDPAAEISFNFKDAPFEQVLNYFQREAGVPIIPEAKVPAGTMTFISARSYDFNEALTIFNKFLNPHGVVLMLEGDYLYLKSLAGAVRTAQEVYEDSVPAGVSPEKVVTVAIPLEFTPANVVAEKVKSFVGEYGNVTAVENQNLLIVVETVAQCDRIKEIVGLIDRKLVDSEIRLFPLQHGKANEIQNALKQLLQVRQETIVIDKSGARKKVEDVNLEGVNFYADARTNSILAVGPKARVDTIEELIRMLDTPDGMSGEQQLRTFRLEEIAPAEAVTHLNALFQAVPAQRKPTMIPLPSTNSVMVIGSLTHLATAQSLIEELDPIETTDRVEREARIIRLEHITPAVVQQTVPPLLTVRQMQAVTHVSTPDGRAIVVAGPPSDLDAFESLVQGLDVAPEQDKEVRVVEFASEDPDALLARARALFDATDPKIDVSTTLDAESRKLTLIGPRAAITEFEEAIRTAGAFDTIERVKRTYTTTNVRASQLGQHLARLAEPLLANDDGTPFVMPEFQAVDELDQLIIRAEPDQFGVLEELLTRLDVETAGDWEFSIVPVRMGDPERIVARARSFYEARTANMDPLDAGPVDVQIDEYTGHLLISARAGGMRAFQAALQQAQQLVPPARTTRMLDLEHVQASDILPDLRAFLDGADSIDPSRAVEPPKITVIDRTNSFMITAEAAQHQLVADYVRRLDVVEPPENLPSLRLLQLKSSDAMQIAQMLNEHYSRRPGAERTEKPVEVTADAGTNTLIVAAHDDLFDNIRAYVDELNKQSEEDGPERETILFTLKVAKAQDVATAMDKLYPEPPLPRDNRGRPMPWLQEDKEVTVSAEPNSNALIIDAPSDRIESLRALAEKLDTVDVPPVAELRTYQVVGANLDAIVRTLKGLSSSGDLQGPPQPGIAPVRVTIESEPKSGTLIVAGDEVTFERVEQILQDLSAVPVEKALRIIPVANVDAADFRDRALAIYDAQVRQIPGANPVDVTVNEATNSIEVVADVEAMDRFVDIIDELQRQTGPARDVRMIELRFAEVTEVIAFLEEMVAASESLRVQGGPDPVFEPIESTNSILVAAQPTQFAIIEQLVSSIDNQQTVDRPPLRIMRLEATEASSLAQVLSDSFDRRAVEERAQKPVEIRADVATNTLIVSAHPDVLPEIQSIVDELNEQSRFSNEGREIRIFPLRVARAEDLARTIDDMFPEPPMPYDNRGRPLPHLRQPKEIFVRADATTNSLIVDAPSQRLAGFEQIVTSLDQRSFAEDIEVRTYRMTKADVQAVATAVRDLASKGALGDIVGQTPVTVSTEPAMRTLVVSGPTSIFTNVERVLNDFDRANDQPGTVLRMYRLQHARADRLQPLLEQLLRTRLREIADDEGIAVEDSVSLLDVASDASSNTLIISAPESLQQIATELVEMLDTERAAIGRNVIRVTPLTYVDATSASQTLTQMTSTMDLAGAVRIMAAVGSNALLISASERDLAQIEPLLAELDVRPYDPEKIGVTTYALEHADADTIAKTVERVLVEQQQTDPRILLQLMRTRRSFVPDPPQIRVEAEPRTNALIVSGPQESLELASTIIEQLDLPGDDARTILTYTPTRREPTELASAVQDVVDATFNTGREPLLLKPEPTSGSIVIIGQPEQAAEAAKMLADFEDRTPDLPQVELAVYDLEHASAAALATTMQRMLDDESRWPDVLRRAKQANLTIPLPTVSADTDANRLVVSAPSVLMPIASTLVETLDGDEGRARPTMRVFRLDEGDATSIADAVRAGLEATATAGAPTPVVTPEATSNSLVIAGTASQLEEAGKLIQSMDESVEPGGVTVSTIFLEHARAESVAPIVERVLAEEDDPNAAFIRSWRFQPEPEDDEPEVRIAADRRLNAVVVSGPIRTVGLAEEIILSLDDEHATARAASTIVQVIPLRNAEATQVAENLRTVFDDEDAEAPPRISVDASSNTMLVRGSAAQIETIRGLAQEIDRSTLHVARELRTLPVDRTRLEASVMADQLKRLLESQQGVRVRVIDARDLLENRPASDASDRGEEGSTLEDPFDGFRAVPSLHEWIVNAAFAIQPDDTAPTDGAETFDEDDSDLTIAIDPATNSLLLIGSSRLAERAALLAETLEAQMPAEPVGVNVLRLPQEIDARNILIVIRQTLNQIGRSSLDNPGGFTGDVATALDPDGNSVIIWANDTDFESIRAIVAAVAQPIAADSVTVKLYPLENVPAARAKSSIEDLLQPSPTGRQAQQVRRDMALRIDGFEAVIDPRAVHVSTDPGESALIVVAPDAAVPVIDRFVSLIDQNPVKDRLAIRRYELDNADADAMARMLGQLFEAQRQGPMRREMAEARFVADDRTNSILVTASSDQHEEVVRLLDAADAAEDRSGLELAILPLQQARSSTVESVVREIIVARDPGREIIISGDDDSNMLVVFAEPEDLEDIRRIVREVDTTSADLPVRTIRLEHADAQVVAQSLQRFFQDRNRTRGRNRQQVMITGDRRTGVLVVAASDVEFDAIQSIASEFDADEVRGDFEYRIIALENSRVADLRETIDGIATNMLWERRDRNRNQQAGTDDRIYIQTNDRLNAFVLVGEGGTMDTMQEIISSLDIGGDAREEMIVRAVEVPGRADMNSMRRLIVDVMADPNFEWWWGDRDPEAVEVQVDTARRLIYLVGKKARVDLAESYIQQLAGAGGGEDREIASIQLEYAQATRAGQALQRFFRDRAEAEGLRDDQVSIIGSSDGNVLMVAADTESMEILRQFVAQIDQPELGTGRKTEIYYLRHADATQLATTVRDLFPATRGDERMIVIPQRETNMVIVSSPQDAFADVDALIAQLDQPPPEDVSTIRTVTLKNGQATIVAEQLEAAIPEMINLKITPVTRSNALMLTGAPEAIDLAISQIEQLDQLGPQRSQQLLRVRLEHAMADDIDFTLSQMLRNRQRPQGMPMPTVDYLIAENTIIVLASPDELDEIAQWIDELDVPLDENRRTEFVKLKFADAEQTANALEVFYGRLATEARTPGARNVKIVPDPASNSLVISADETEWENIMALLERFDTAEYDTTRNLEVIPLRHADARSVASALNEGFRAPLDQRLREEQVRMEQERRNRQQNNNNMFVEPRVLVESDETPSVAAEPQTNSLIVFASRTDMERIQGIVAKLDVPEFADLPDARLITIENGRATDMAATVRQIFQSSQRGMRRTVIYGDDASSTLIVRAEESEFTQIAALVESLQQEQDDASIRPHIARVEHVPAARLRDTIQQVFRPIAQEQGEALAVQIDRSSNAVIVACSDDLFLEIQKLVAELDQPAMGAGGELEGAGIGQSVYVVDLEHTSPQEMRSMLEALGVTRQVRDDQPGVVSEPVTLVPLATRPALAIMANPADAKVMLSLVKSLDGEFDAGAQHVSFVALKTADAPTLVRTLEGILDTSRQSSPTGAAESIAEHLSRLNFSRRAMNEAPLSLDLDQPIRLLADTTTNSVLVASTEHNVDALTEVIELFDRLPLGDAVVVRIFPLDHASAVRVQAVVEDLFSQGEQLSRSPGSNRTAEPTTATGQALIGEIASAVDDRTNALIVAGREEAVAFVEVLIADLDRRSADNWIEPTVIPLEYASAGQLAETIRDVLVRGIAQSPEALGLQQQVARISMLRAGGDPTNPDDRVDGDLFAPLSGLVVQADDQMNALVVVGSRANLEVVRELVAVLDVERAAAGNSVRIFPLEHAAADRVASMVREIFEQREDSGTTLPADRLILVPDARTNALVVSTSEASFRMLESLLPTLDASEANDMVGLHIIPVPSADVNELAPKIERLMRDRLEHRSRSGGIESPMDAFSIEAEGESNLLIVACSAENLALVHELVEAFTSGAGEMAEAERTAIISLDKTPAVEIVEDIRQLYVEPENRKRGEGAVSVIANARINSLIVSGTEEDVRIVRGLVAQFDGATNPLELVVRRFELDKGNAREIADMIEGVLAGESLTGTRITDRQATRLFFYRSEVAEDLEEVTGQEPTETEIDNVIRQQVTLTPELRTNSIFVKAPAEVMDFIAALIDEIDASDEGIRQIAQFKLENADAYQMAGLLEDLFRVNRSDDVLYPTESGPQPMDRDPDWFGRQVTPLQDPRSELSITVDARTNTLLISGTEEYLELVREIVIELDAKDANERTTNVIELQNADAAEVQATLENFFRGEANRLNSILGDEMRGSLARQLEREVTVVGDPSSNKLIIAASPRYIDMVSTIVEELDAAPPQVMIQVLLAEVTLDSGNTWGVDVDVGPIGGQGYTFGSLAAGSGVAAALGVPNLSFGAADFNILIRSLQQQGKLEVLSEPKVTVNNNQQANINVGENIAIVSGVERFSDGNSSANVERRDVGIILDVMPSISSDGFVRMDIRPEISSVSQRTDQISADVSAPRINTRSVETTVTVRDGQTVVIGGLFQTTQEERETSVPIIGDFPVLGLPFRSRQVSQVKTELLVILTPHVIPGGDGRSATLLDGPPMEAFQNEDLTQGAIQNLTDPDPILRMLLESPAGEDK